MDDKKIKVLAGMMAYTNYGFQLPDKYRVEYAIRMADRGYDADNMVIIFAESIIEDEDMSDNFRNEAMSWYEDLKKMDESEIKRIWSDHYNMIMS